MQQWIILPDYWVLFHLGFEYSKYCKEGNDLERVQKSAIKVILQEKIKGYQNGLAMLDLEDFKTRREYLCLEFAKKCVKSKQLCQMFPKTQEKLMFMRCNMLTLKG